MECERYDRQVRLFGREGQERLRKTHVAVIGVGGLGSHLVQQLAHLGVGQLTLIDNDAVEFSNLNRLIGSRPNDAKLRKQKVAVMNRMISMIDPQLKITLIPHTLLTEKALSEVKQCDYIFGCVDNDGARLVLIELCAAYEIPYIDLAAEVIVDSTVTYGGRIFIQHDNQGCLYCYGEISADEAQSVLESQKVLETRESVYGVNRDVLGDSGPSVVTLNGVIASLAADQFMAMATNLRKTPRFLAYRGDLGGFVTIRDEPPENDDCFYCKSIRGIRDRANIERYMAENPVPV